MAFEKLRESHGCICEKPPHEVTRKEPVRGSKGTPQEPQQSRRGVQDSPLRSPNGASKPSKIDPKMDPSKFVQKGGRHSPIFLLWSYKFQGFFDRRPPGYWGSWGPFWGPILGSLVYLFKCIYIYIYNILIYSILIINTSLN